MGPRKKFRKVVEKFKKIPKKFKKIAKKFASEGGAKCNAKTFAIAFLSCFVVPEKSRTMFGQFFDKFRTTLEEVRTYVGAGSQMSRRLVRRFLRSAVCGFSVPRFWVCMEITGVVGVFLFPNGLGSFDVGMGWVVCLVLLLMI